MSFIPNGPLIPPSGNFSSILGSIISSDNINLNVLAGSSDTFSDVTMNSKQGIITITNVSLLNGQVHTLTLTNSYVNSNSAILLSVTSGQTVGSFCGVNASNITDGSFDINILSLGAEASIQTISVTFLILN